ncbi:MAG: hypothetical protein R3B96_21430 [Pirellulaceae bacterium]
MERGGFTLAMVQRSGSTRSSGGTGRLAISSAGEAKVTGAADAKRDTASGSRRPIACQSSLERSPDSSSEPPDVTTLSVSTLSDELPRSTQ